MPYLFMKLHEVWWFKKVHHELWEGNKKVFLRKHQGRKGRDIAAYIYGQVTESDRMLS